MRFRIEVGLGEIEALGRNHGLDVCVVTDRELPERALVLFH